MNSFNKLNIRFAKKVLRITSMVVGTFMALLFILPFFFTESVGEKIRDFANKNLDGELNYQKMNLSFYRHFPNLTLTIHDFLLKGSEPFGKDTLVAANELAFAVNVGSLFSETIKISKIYLLKGFINVQVTEGGQANYNVYSPEESPEAMPAEEKAADTLPDNTSFRIESIRIKNTRLVYNDRSLPLYIDADDFNYEGKGDLSKSIFDLYTKAEIGSFDLAYDGTPYILDKKMTANLITKINTTSLAFVFERNDLKINQLPVRFTGQFGFLENGYDMEFIITSDNTGLRDLFTALPPEYLFWLDETEVNGKANLTASLVGKYITETNSMPDLALNLSVNDGFISHEKSPAAIENLTVQFETKIPGLNFDSLTVNIDSLHFNVGKDYFTSVIRLKGLSNPFIFAKLDTKIDLEKWIKASGIDGIDAGGHFETHILADGQLIYGPDTNSLRKENKILSVPTFNFKSSLADGYFKYNSMPESIRNLAFEVTASCDDGVYNHTRFLLKGLNAEFLENYVRGYFESQGIDEILLAGKLNLDFDLSDIAKVYQLDSITLAGKLLAGLETKGIYAPSGEKFPVTNATINLKDGFIKTAFYPGPVQNLNLTTTLNIPSINPADVQIVINPFSFIFEGKTFNLKATLNDLTDLKYDIQSNGAIDVGKIYQVFAMEGVDLEGLITTDFKLKGKQSDATEGRLSMLENSGSLVMSQIALRSELFPMPFVVGSGEFKFDQDKIKFNQIKASYGGSNFVLNGYLNNIINYAVDENGKLKGNLKLNSDKLIVDDFMVFAADSAKSQVEEPDSSLTASEETGVVMVPENLEIAFTTDVKEIAYGDLLLKDFHGLLEIKDGLLLLKEAGFNLIDAEFRMDATYGCISPMSAYFDYHISAENFDIHRAYNEIGLFREMCSPAENAEGIVSLDYSLKGKLDGEMMPVLPSLEGGGVLSVKKVKISGFKMFSEVSKKTQKQELNDPDISKVDIKTHISNNTITIEPFKFRFAGFRPKISGQSTFDGRMNIKMRLGLPPLGIFGLPIKITGTADNPKIKFGKGGNETDEIKETDYSEEIPEDMLKMIKEAKAENIEDEQEEIPQNPGEIK